MRTIAVGLALALGATFALSTTGWSQQPEALTGTAAIEKRQEVQVKLNQLVQIREALDDLIASCPGGGDVKACTILEAMERRTSLLRAETTDAQMRRQKGSKS